MDYSTKVGRLKDYKLLVIVGPTASGKSALAMQLAKDYNGEIISADSWQVYKGFDIGTSKPPLADQMAVKHHLIDVAKASEGFNAPKFQKLANKAIQSIQNRDHLPILAGGTGLYIDSVIYSFSFLPNPSAKARIGLDSMDLKQLLNLADAKKIDLSAVDIRNKRRVIRAIEAKGQKPSKKTLAKGVLIIGINPPKNKLKKEISKRVEKMIAGGLEQEVKNLAQKYGWDIEPMKGIGYKEWRPYFEGSQSLNQVKEKITKNTRDLAKRQMTWFKRNPDIKWFETSKAAYDFLTTNL